VEGEYIHAPVPDASSDAALRQAVDALERTGLLFLHDARRPSVSTLLAGEAIRGSWWGHPAGRRIFQVVSAIEEQGLALFVPLLSAKVTLVHRRLWPALLSVGEARERWQMDPLTDRARELLAEVDRAGRVRSSGPSSKALARALLVLAEQVHTRGGAHATELVAWPAVREQRGLTGRMDVDDARRSLEEAAERLDALSALPWVRGR